MASSAAEEVGERMSPARSDRHGERADSLFVMFLSLTELAGGATKRLGATFCLVAAISCLTHTGERVSIFVLSAKVSALIAGERHTSQSQW